MKNDVDVGFVVVSAEDIDDIGVNGVIKRIRDRVGNNPVYLTYVSALTILYDAPLIVFVASTSLLLLTIGGCGLLQARYRYPRP